ncbi:MAG: hypothetical protein FJ253_03465 [Phycisphaerae bacterium]|nr:hypothetical protein [Phycisphaerae bacterium]
MDVDGTDYDYFPAGSDAGGGYYNYVDSASEGSFDATWNFLGSDSTVAFYTLISGNFTFTNNSDSTQTYDVWVILTTTPNALPSKIGGSVAGGMTADSDGGTLATIDDETPLWSAYMDAAFQAGLIYDASASAGPFDSASIGSDAFGQPIPDMDAGPLGSSIAVRLQFTLTAGDQASFTSVFVLESVPAPGALALLGLAAVVGRRRRA